MATEAHTTTQDKKAPGQRQQRGGRGRRRPRREKPEFEQRLLDLARVTRVVKGGRRFRFRATVVIGNRKGRVGIGVAKGTDVSQAIQKAVEDAKKNMVDVVLDGNTISHDVSVKVGSARVLLKPAPEGRGIIAGGSVRAVVELLGIKDVVAKSLGTSNKLNVARATVVALTQLKTPAGAAEQSATENTSTTTKAATKKTTKKAATKKTAGAVDDLTKVEGIGPKIADVLSAAGISTYALLADTTAEKIQEMIAGVRGSHDASTWPEQAKLAAAGKWDELKKWQDELDGGKSK